MTFTLWAVAYFTSQAVCLSNLPSVPDGAEVNKFESGLLVELKGEHAIIKCEDGIRQIWLEDIPTDLEVLGFHGRTK